MTSPTLIIDVDSTGWTNATEAARPDTHKPSASSPAFVPNWQNVTSDEMKVTAVAQAGDFPNLNEIASVRRYIRTLIIQRGGAIVSCDVADVGKSTAVRCVSKYRAGEGLAMAYDACLFVPVGKWVVELSIRGREHGITNQAPGETWRSYSATTRDTIHASLITLFQGSVVRCAG